MHATRYCVNVNSIIIIVIDNNNTYDIIIFYIANGIDNDISSAVYVFFYFCFAVIITAVQKTYIRTGRRDLRLLNCRRDPQQYRCFTGGPRSACAHSPGPRTRRHLCATAGRECGKKNTNLFGVTRVPPDFAIDPGITH